jgi:sec-independent protein translocase protein TatA
MFTGGFSHAPELIIILVIALIIFGPKKLPSLGKGLGDGIREFRKATSGEGDKEEPAADAGASAVNAAATTTPPPVVEGLKSSTDSVSDKGAKPPATASAAPKP